LMIVIVLYNLVAHGQSSEATNSDDTREQLVVLISGRILSGQVSRNGGGYLVEQSNGRVQLAPEDVQFVVKDLREAYRKHRDGVQYPTPASHLALAQWCIAHRLYEEARDELKKSLKGDPETEEARRLLQRLNDTIRANLPAAVSPPPPLKTSDGFLQPDVESLGGLSRGVAMQFTSKIQPLLLNKCGNATCHGGASNNGFRLISARIGGNGSRQTTERNLAESLKQLDLQDVAASPLLSVSTGGHGGKGTIFAGPAGAEQLKLIKTWAKTVAEEKREDAMALANRPTLKGKTASKGFASRPIMADDETVETARFVKGETEELPLTAEEDASRPQELPVEKNSVRALIEQKPRDPFDPDTFNRLPR
jgi:hypothetical protein